MADLIQGDTQVGSTKQAMIAATVQRELLEGAVVAPLAMDVSAYCEPGAKSIEFPKASHMTVSNRTEGSQGDAQQLVYSTDKMDLNFNAYLAWIIDYKSKIQSRIDVQLDMASRAARAHVSYLDAQIVAALESFGQATTTAGELSYAILVEMMQKFMQNKGKKEQAAWLVGTETWGKLINITELKQYLVYGEVVIPNGVIGSIFGVKLAVSTLVPDQTFYLFDKEAVVYGLQAGPSYSEQPANQYGSQAKRAVLDQIFGTTGQFVAQEGAAAGKSALILKDNN